MSTKPTAKEVTVSKRRQKAMQLADYKWMAEKGLSPEAKRYRDEHIRPKKEKDHDDAERLVRDLLDDNGGQDHSEGAGDGNIYS